MILLLFAAVPISLDHEKPKFQSVGGVKNKFASLSQLYPLGSQLPSAPYPLAPLTQLPPPKIQRVLSLTNLYPLPSLTTQEDTKTA